MMKAIKIIALVLVLVLLAFLVPTGGLLNSAFGDELPTYTPVELGTGYAPLDADSRPTYTIPAENYSDDMLSYRDDSLNVQIIRTRAYDTPIFIAYVQIADVSQLRMEQAERYPSRASAKPNQLAKRVNAVLTTNGDYFVYHSSGIVYRQGKLLRDKANADFDALIIDRNGDFHIVAPLTREAFEAAVPTEEIWQSFCFGPALVIDGVIKDNSERVVTYKQRLAFGQLDTLTYVLVATDGPEEKDSVGLSIPQLSQLMLDLGVKNAYNMDGGASTYMGLGGKKINGQKELKLRAVGDILYFTTLIPNE